MIQKFHLWEFIPQKSLASLSKPINFIPTTTSFMALSRSRPLFTCPSHPRPGTRKLRIAPMPQSLVELFEQANSKSAFHASRVPSRGNHNNGSGPQFHFLSLLWPTLVLPPVVLDGALCSSQGTLSITVCKTLSSFSLLICIWSHRILPKLIWLKC